MNRRPCRNDATARNFWQSRMTTTGKRAPLPPLVDINQLARDLRATWNASCA